jgi:hypothetical protein
MRDDDTPLPAARHSRPPLPGELCEQPAGGAVAAPLARSRAASMNRAAPAGTSDLVLLSSLLRAPNASQERTTAVLRASGLLDYFGGSNFGSDFVPRPKPAPDLLLHLATRMKGIPGLLPRGRGQPDRRPRCAGGGNARLSPGHDPPFDRPAGGARSPTISGSSGGGSHKGAGENPRAKRTSS